MLLRAHKLKRRKMRYLSGGPPWTGTHKKSRRRANRRERHQIKVELRP